ncbi:cell surface glycoprotein [Streptomyces sp. JV185]|uniref:zinc finger domain-containing protein n=1 Tax=Streptomyces sp. JV185 TaxID=858638 RepID=UPI002E764E02|nr:cell surface glycoprotein [Streptomyces sp. JV185]MEE1774480.1 cell surface glycoprotein [Streptomyces sp. JV185]
MKPSEVPQLLAQIALADPRVRREDEFELRAQIAMWAGILAEVPYDYAITAAHQHYAKSTWPILPADIATRWAATVRDRMDKHTGTFEPVAHPELDPDDIPGFQAALRSDREAVVLGHTEPTELKAITAGLAAYEADARWATLGSYVPIHVRDALAEQRPERAERERLLRTGQPDPLSVQCPWDACRAPAGQRCNTRGRTRHDPHPARIDAARAARETAA